MIKMLSRLLRWWRRVDGVRVAIQVDPSGGDTIYIVSGEDMYQIPNTPEARAIIDEYKDSFR